MKIYQLKGNYEDNCFFSEIKQPSQEWIMYLSMKNSWSSLENYIPVKLNLMKNYNNKKNYNFDISLFLSPFIVLSDKTKCFMEDILESRGQFLEVITESKRKKFIGYYPTNVLKGCFDFKRSIFREAENGLIIDKPVLLKEFITDKYLFTIEEDISRIFVTDKFKKIVEENNLIGFEFSEYNEVELS